MVITHEVLKKFDACELELEAFVVTFPDGLDISGLWEDRETRKATWRTLLGYLVVRRNVGWGIEVGLIPARIDADLRKANLSRANLRKADLHKADLREADLSEADLSRANLRKADLRKADLRKADLSEADLREADLRNADLRWADMRKADVRGVRHNADTRWPDGFDVARLVPV